jgi:hypothetical protein
MTTMRMYPVDSNRVNMISTGRVKPVAEFGNTPDGYRPTGAQAVDELTRLPLWEVEVITPADEDDDRDKTAVVAVAIAAKDKPDGGSFGDLLQFEGLAVLPPYFNKKKNAMSPERWSASSIRRQGKPQQQPQAA